MSAKPRPDDIEARRNEYYARVGEDQLVPLWLFFKDWFTLEPHVQSLPHVWSYEALRETILEAAAIVDPADAERRVLALENPGLPGRRLATESLYAGLQLMMPGELAPCHRHTPTAMRFVLESDGAYTAVNGERCYMKPGDFIVTPAWTWHDHGHEGDGPTVWLDVLDVAMTHLFNATFTEHYPDDSRPEPTEPLDTLHRYGMNMLPVGYERGQGASPIFSYPYERTREVIERLKDHSELDACHGLKMEYVDPTTGGPAMPTISAHMQLLPAGFTTESYRTTAGTIYCPVEGAGTVEFPGAETPAIEYRPWDIFVIPSWQEFRIAADTESTIFSASDQAAQEKLRMWREQRGSKGS